jgi:DNA-binding MarR family transcriptional regulator
VHKLRGYPNASNAAEKRTWAIIDALRRYGTGSTRLTQTFAAQHGLQQSDLQALVAIMAAEGADEPLTPGRLQKHLGLSSAGTTYVIDRLEKAGYVQRTQDHPRNRRMVQLRYTEQGMATAMDFFGPIGERTASIVSQFSAADQQVIHRFVTTIAEVMQENIEQLEADGKPKAPARKPG